MRFIDPFGRSGAAILLALCAFGVPSLALAKDAKKADITKTDKKKKKTKKKKKAWNVSASYGLRIGQGTFVDPPETSGLADASSAFDRVMNVYSFGAGYKLSDNFSLGTGLTWTHWLTQGGGSIEPNETRFQNIGVSGSWSGVKIEAINARLTGSASVSLPTSDYSRAAGTLLGTGAGLGLSKTFFKKLTFSYRLSGGKTFHQAITPVADLSRAGSGNVLFRAGGSENLGSGIVAIGGYNTEYSLSNSFSARVPVIDHLNFSASYSLGTFWTYAHPDGNDDEFRSPNAKSGRGVGQSVSGSAGLSYSFLDHFSASMGISTSQPPKTSDNKSFNFPFWNFKGAAANKSSLKFGLSASY